MWEGSYFCTLSFIPFWNVILAIPHYTDYCKLVLRTEIKYYESSIFVFLFQKLCFLCSESLNSPPFVLNKVGPLTQSSGDL